MSSRFLALMGVTVFCATAPVAVRADIPRTISFQGVLNGANGAPKPNGPYTVTFRLFDALQNGNLQWTEANKTVTVAGGKGYFSTVLGNPTPFGALTFNQPYFLEIQIAGEAAPMTPRVALQSVPYALNTPSASLTLPFSGSLSTANSVGITVQNSGGGGNGFRAVTDSGRGFWGTTNGSYGVYGEALTTGVGVLGKAVNWIGVYGESATGTGVWGRGTNGNGVYGSADTDGIGVYGESAASEGVRGTSHNLNHGGVVGINTASGIAVYGTSNGAGVAGYSTGWIGTYGESQVTDGVQGVSHADGHAGVAGISLANGFGIYGRSDGGGYAGYFDGKIRVTVIDIAGGSDVAEKFDASEKAEPGTVMAIDPEHAGKLCVARGAYNTTVAGVISGANNLGVGMVLPDAGGVKDGLPVAMAGRVWVKCDASFGAIRPGDLLTTSDTAGYAMRVSDHTRSPGATLGKAMTALADGRGVVLTLVNLQ